MTSKPSSICSRKTRWNF